MLLLASAAFHALWNAIAKLGKDPEESLRGILVVAMCLGPFFIPFFSGPLFPTAKSFLFAVGAGFAEAVYLFALARALRASSLAASYTIMRGGALFLVWIFSLTWMGERVQLTTIAGASLVLFGILSANKSPWRAIFSGGDGWAFACAIFIAAYHLFYRAALAEGAQAAALYSLSLGIAVPIFLLTSGRGLKGLGETIFSLRVLIGGVLCALSFLVFLIGMADTGAGIAITLRNTSVVFAQIFALMIGERVMPRQWAGAFLVAGGAAIIALN